MSDFAYFDGEKWVENLTMKDIRALAMSGVIMGTTLIRNPDGQEKEARFLGLVFSNKPVKPATNFNAVSQEEDESIMQPAITIIHVLYCLAVAVAVLSGFAVMVGVLLVLPFDIDIGLTVLIIGVLFVIEFVITAALLAVLKCFAICVGQIEKNTRKED